MDESYSTQESDDFCSDALEAIVFCFLVEGSEEDDINVGVKIFFFFIFFKSFLCEAGRSRRGSGMG